MFTFISQDFGHFLVRFLEYLANARAEIINFRKSSNLKSRYLQNYLDFFKSFWCFGKPMDRSFQLSELERLARSFFKILTGVLGVFSKNAIHSPTLGGEVKGNFRKITKSIRTKKMKKYLANRSNS